jgi:hypothetical protein
VTPGDLFNRRQDLGATARISLAEKAQYAMLRRVDSR